MTIKCIKVSILIPYYANTLFKINKGGVFRDLEGLDFLLVSESELF